MQLIPFKIERIPNLSCVEQILKGMADWKKSSYELMFLEEWDFNYLDNDADLVEKFNLYSERKYELLEKYHGIKISYHKTESPEAVFTKIKESILCKQPIGIIVDSFWLPWDITRYQKVSLLHILLVVGIDEATQELICIDAQLAAEGERLDRVHFDKACVEYTLFEFQNVNKKLNFNNMIADLKENVCENDHKKEMSARIKRFANDFANSNHMEEFSKNDLSPSEDPLLNNILKVSDQRNNFANALDYFDQEFGQSLFREISNDLVLASEKWRTVFGLLIKSYYAGNFNKVKDRAYERIMAIQVFENEIFEKLNSIVLTGETIDFVAENEYGHYNGSIMNEFIDLKAYFNNKGICYEDKIINGAELSNPNRFIMIENGFTSSLDVENMVFDFNYIGDELDNVSCTGQEIAFNNKSYDCISVLSCSEFANYRENMHIIFDDETIEVVELTSSSWINSESNYDEVLAFHGVGALKMEKEIKRYPFPVSLFAKCYKLKKKGRIKKIILPNFPNIHIFGISGCAVKNINEK